MHYHAAMCASGPKCSEITLQVGWLLGVWDCLRTLKPNGRTRSVSTRRKSYDGIVMAFRRLHPWTFLEPGTMISCVKYCDRSITGLSTAVITQTREKLWTSIIFVAREYTSSYGSPQISQLNILQQLNSDVSELPAFSRERAPYDSHILWPPEKNAI